MRVRGNIVLQYSVATFIIIFGVSVALGITLARRITDYQLRSHIRLFPELIALTVKNNPQVYRCSAPRRGDRLRGHGGNPARPVRTRTIFRVKVWSRDGTIVWSDSHEEIGQKFPDDPPLVEALTGKAAYELGESENEEAVIEKNRGSLLQVYTPVMKDGVAVGVVELYEANSDLFAQIARNTVFVEGLVAAQASSCTLPSLPFSFAPTRARNASTRKRTGSWASSDSTSPPRLSTGSWPRTSARTGKCATCASCFSTSAISPLSRNGHIPGKSWDTSTRCSSSWWNASTATRGSSNKFLGDGFMAVFGAPIPDDRNCHHALKASIEILNELARFNAGRGGEATRVGIGLHAGYAVTGQSAPRSARSTRLSVTR